MLESDVAALSRHHEFVRDDEEDSLRMRSSWEVRMARAYYDGLIKEYVICDLSQAEQGRVGMRWRTKAEVLRGKGETICANKHCSEEQRPGMGNLTTYEVPFRYNENGMEKNELVKVCACSACAVKLHYSNDKDKDKRIDKEGNKKKSKSKKDKKRPRDADEPDQPRKVVR